MSTPDGGRADTGPDRRRVALLAAAAVLAVLAGVAVVLADDARWLRLGVVAALWTVVLVMIALARRVRAEAAVAADAEDAAAGLAAAGVDAEDRVETLRREHDERLAREVAAREEAEQIAEKAREDAAGLREELDRVRVHADAATLQGGLPVAAPRGARLRIVGDSGPQPRMPAAGMPAAPAAPAASAGAAASAVPATPAVPAVPAASPVPPPAPVRPIAPVAPVAASPVPAVFPTPRSGGPDSGPAGRPWRPAGPLPDGPPTADPSVLTAGSFVDQYVRSAGYGPAVDASARRDLPPELPDERSDERSDERRARRAAPSPGEAVTSGGRTVAELLAAHAAAGGSGGRRRRDP